jgi:cobalt-zinc-cadmium efflux system membrane fusion protein
MRASIWIASLALAASAACIGCSSDELASPPANATAAEGEHDHSGWWCAEHGVPEEVCTRCDPSLVAEFKEKGDWCEEHDLPDSQCFIHHPENEAKFAAQYEAKYGEQPPKPTE